ncbi:MAG: hypothetical protein ACR2QH_13810 [Geminicoccaceae bacterium]
MQSKIKTMSYRPTIIVIFLNLIFCSDSIAQNQLTPDQHEDLNERARDLEDQAGLLDIDTAGGGGSIDIITSWAIERLFNQYEKEMGELPEDLRVFFKNNIDPETIREARKAEAKKLREEAARLRRQAMVKPTKKKQLSRAECQSAYGIGTPAYWRCTDDESKARIVEHMGRSQQCGSSRGIGSPAYWRCMGDESKARIAENMGSFQQCGSSHGIGSPAYWRCMGDESKARIAENMRRR